MNKPTINSLKDIENFILGLGSRLFNPESPYKCGFGVYDNSAASQVEFEYIRDYVLYHSNFEYTVYQYGRKPNGRGDYGGSQHLPLKFAQRFILYPKSVSYGYDYRDGSDNWSNITDEVIGNSLKKWGDKPFEDYRMFRINKREKQNRSTSHSMVSRLEEQLKKNSELSHRKNPEQSVGTKLNTVVSGNVMNLSSDDLRTLKRAGEILTQLTSNVG
jgi:hypothetical protein